MVLITESRNNNISFLMQNDYKGLYNILARYLSKEQINLFALPEESADKRSIRWYSIIPGSYTNADIIDYEQLKDEDKYIVLDIIENLKKEIGIKLKKQSIDYWELFFVTPALKDLKVIEIDNKYVPVITQWGCNFMQATSTISPIEHELKKPRPNTALVTVDFYYNDGSKAINKLFYLEYLNVCNEKYTDKEGYYYRGFCLLNSNFTIYDLIKNNKKYIHTFTVTPDTTYKVIFPILTDVLIKVIDQKDILLCVYPIIIKYDGIETDNNTGKTGIVKLEDLETGKDITIIQKDKPENFKTYKIEKTNNEFVLKIHQPVLTNATIKIVNDKDEIQLNYPFLVEYYGKTDEYNTAETGIVNINNLVVGKEIKVINKDKPDNFQLFKIEEENNDFILKILNKLISVKLIDHKKNLLPNIPVCFTYNGKIYNKITDTDGICKLPFDAFKDKEKVAAKIELPKKDKKKVDIKKVVNKSFIFKNSQTEYILKINKFNWWWLLLLLLLLLFIPLKKDVYIKTIDVNGNPISNCNVSFLYKKSFLFDYVSKKFFTNDTTIKDTTTNIHGVGHFAELKYSVFSYIFHHLSPAIVSASSGCYMAAALKPIPIFHSLSSKDTLILQLAPILMPLDFKVVDKADNEELPNSKVKMFSDIGGKIFQEDGNSAVDGRVVFNQIPKCANSLKIVASAEGYYSDSIVIGDTLSRKSINDLIGDINAKRLLRLQPIRKTITFFVIDCKTKQPLAGADVTIDFTIAGKKRQPATVSTNTKGVGKGGYDSSFVNARIHLSASKHFYKPGIFPDSPTVKEFIESPKYQTEASRTFCLEPDPHPIEFTTIDSCSRALLPGVKNKVIIKNAAGTTTKIVYSNSSGIIPISAMPDDIVTIISIDSPYYNDNNTKIVNAKWADLIKGTIADRTIALSPVMVDLNIRTVEEGNNNNAVPDAKLVVSVSPCNAASFTTQTNSSGVKMIHVPLNATISITASKESYGTNSSKINAKTVLLLQNAQQWERDIPLLKNTPPPHDSIPGEHGELRFNLQYDNPRGVDLDLHVITPHDIHIYHAKLNGDNGKQDRDCLPNMNDLECQPIAYENTRWVNESEIPTGEYTYYVIYYAKNGSGYQSSNYTLRVFKHNRLIETHTGTLQSKNEKQLYNINYP